MCNVVMLIDIDIDRYLDNISSLTCLILISPTRLSPSMPESESDLTEKPRSLMRPRVEEEVLLTSLPALSTLQ